MKLLRICAALASLALLALAAGCRTAGQQPQSHTGPAPSSTVQPRARGSANVLPGYEIQTVDASTVFDALRRLRPEWLTRRAAPLPTDPYGGYPVVYLDGRLQGALEMLQTIPARAVLEIRYVGASAAFDAFGTYHPGGAIAVRTRR